MDGVSNRGIVLLFDDDTNQKAIELGANYGAMLGTDPDLALGLERNLPHMTMTQLPVNDVRIPTIEGWLTSLAGTGTAKRAKQGSFSSVRLHNEYCLWLTALTNELRMLHEEVIKEMFRHRAERQPFDESLNKDEVEMWIHYGVPNVGRNFLPHLTLVPKINAGNVWQTETFQQYTVTHIAIAEIGPRGVVRSILKKIPV